MPKPVINNIYFVDASPHWPVGNAGAVVIAKNKKRVTELLENCGLYKPEEPKPIGISRLKEQVVFYNNGNY